MQPVAEVLNGAYEPAYGADAALGQALHEMDKKFRVPLVLYYLEGYSVKEISAMLRCPGGTVKNLLFRAREKLRCAYHNQEVFEDET